VKDGERDLAIGHALHKLSDGAFVIVRHKRGAEPQSKRPRRWQGRTAGERGVAFQYLQGRGAEDHIVLEPLPGHTELHALYLFRGHLEGDALRVVDEHTVSPVRQVEWHVLVCLLAGRAAILVPDVHRLAVLHKRREPLTQAIHALAHAQVELVVNVSFTGVCFNIASAAPARAREDAVPMQKIDAPGRPFVHPHRQLATGEAGGIGTIADCDLCGRIGMELKRRMAHRDSLVVEQLDPDHVRHR